MRLGRIPLSVVITEMALSPKSNSAHVALDEALKDAESGLNYEIPDTIKITSTTYKYPHDYPGSFVVQDYMPKELKNRKYYKAKLTSNYEKSLNEIYERIEKKKKEEN